MLRPAKTILQILPLLFLLFTFSCGGDDSTEEKTVEDVDGNVYTTVKIGTQTWMVENLRTTHFRDGTPITNVTVNAQWPNLTTAAYCTYLNDEANAELYGQLYNWYAVNGANQLAPEGWHVATLEEWETLIDHLGGNVVAGGKLKGTTHWESPNVGATNSSGFTAYGGGGRGGSGNFLLLNDTGYWWTGTQISTTHAHYTAIPHYAEGIDQQNTSKWAGFSVRCVKD